MFRKIDEAVRDVGSQLTGGRKGRSGSWASVCGYLGMLNMGVGVLFLLWTFQMLGVTAKITGACVGTSLPRSTYHLNMFLFLTSAVAPVLHGNLFHCA